MYAYPSYPSPARSSHETTGIFQCAKNLSCSTDKKSRCAMALHSPTIPRRLLRCPKACFLTSTPAAAQEHTSSLAQGKGPYGGALRSFRQAKKLAGTADPLVGSSPCSSTRISKPFPEKISASSPGLRRNRNAASGGRTAKNYARAGWRMGGL